MGARHYGTVLISRMLRTRKFACELFAFRWKDFDEANRCLHVDEAVYEGTFDTPKN
jgi:hypothetical protein